ncbi:MAG: YncE family protein [Deltaproteobacteria bacterium]|nr:YncE family protein [Deltaproteobacteria bacterium]
MTRTFQKRRRLRPFALLPLLLILLAASPSLAAIQMNFEVPSDDQKVSGIGPISGWAFSDTGAAVTVTVTVDNGMPATVPCCAERQDVANANGAFGLNSGFGQIFNFNILSSGNHTLVIKVQSGVGEEATQSHQVSVVKPGGFEFLTRLDLVFAGAEVKGGTEIEITKAHAVDKATLKDQEVTLRLAWQQNTQTLAIVKSEDTGSATPSFTATDPAGARSAVTVPAPGHANETATEIQLSFENPPADQAASGVGVLSGWTFSPNAGATYPPTVEFRVDGGEYKRLPCCQERQDVATAFPDQAAIALLSGFGSVFNFNTLSSDSHTIEVRTKDGTLATDDTEVMKSATHEVVVVKPGDFEFLDQFDLSEAEAVISGLSLIIDFVKVRDKATQQIKEVFLRYNWEPSCQCFVVQGDCGNGSVEPLEECDGDSFELDGEIQTCETLGFDPETTDKKLKCTLACMFDTTDCTGGPRVLVTNRIDNSVSFINTATNLVKTTIRVGKEPYGIVVSPTAPTAYVANFKSDTVSVIDTTTERVTHTIPLRTGNKNKGPQGIAVSPNGDKVYVANGFSNSVSIIDTQTKSVVGEISVGVGPQDVALTPDGARAYVTNFYSNSVSVIDIQTNTVIATIPVGKRPTGIATSPLADANLAYVANSLVKSSGTFPEGTIFAIDTTTNTTTGDAIGVSFVPVKVAFPPDGSKVYVANFLADAISIIDPTTKEILNGIQTADHPIGMVVTPNGRRLYIALYGDNGNSSFVQVASTLTNSDIADFIEVEKGPFGLAIVP